MELILFAMVGLVVIVALLASRLNDNSFPFPFDRKNAIFTPAEKNFQNLVEQAMGPDYRVLNRVKLSDILTIRNGVSSKASQAAANNADKKYLDFVLCDRNTMKLLGAIDLVDTQGKGYKLKKDWFVSGALEAASIPHLRIKVKANYTVEEIRSCINTRLIGKAQPEPKMKGSVIPAPMVRVRSKNTAGVLSPAAARSQLEEMNKPKVARQIPAPRVAALPH
ncbi:DUF2726 domain-containing protein [Pseudocolwellia sp. AS88]|jgi:hypothetical protein|uniref:DUF2726 domain-containing protein n=1 Tax=Pseudocolwellia TaxID=2848177 RepID=UPI0026EB5916|nr:DUF2726 domain-containing protein [Pseudocolwellia sp. AS88]MDO7084254.1 DUF2726 domain-containing protein [Pseudocolwellia sp. AS88]